MVLNFAATIPRTPRDEEIVRRSKIYEGLSEDELKVEGLVTTESLRQYGLLASFQNIEPVSGRGQTQVSADIREQIALELSKVICKAVQDEGGISPSWEERFPDPLSEAEEIEARHAAAYPNEGTPGAGTSGIGKDSFHLIRTLSLAEVSRTSQMGFDPRFLRIDPRRVPFDRYCDRVDELVGCLSEEGLPEGVTMVDPPSLSMLFPDFKEYGSFLEQEAFSDLARGGPFTPFVHGRPSQICSFCFLFSAGGLVLYLRGCLFCFYSPFSTFVCWLINPVSYTSCRIS